MSMSDLGISGGGGGAGGGGGGGFRSSTKAKNAKPLIRPGALPRTHPARAQAQHARALMRTRACDSVSGARNLARADDMLRQQGKPRCSLRSQAQRYGHAGGRVQGSERRGTVARAKESVMCETGATEERREEAGPACRDLAARSPAPCCAHASCAPLQACAPPCASAFPRHEHLAPGMRV